MLARRAPRLLLEIAFLAALAAALTFSGLRSFEIASLMILGWVLVAVFEWGALRSRPHYGSGLPPRWYVPQIALPPPRPLEQVGVGYPAAAEPTNDAPTWIASPEDLAEWPVSDVEPRIETPPEEQTQVHDALELELAVAVAQTEDEVAPPELDPGPRELAVSSSGRTSRHRIDPLAEPAAKSRRFGRRGTDDGGAIEVPERMRGSRLLPSVDRRED